MRPQAIEITPISNNYSPQRGPTINKPVSPATNQRLFLQNGNSKEQFLSPSNSKYLGSTGLVQRPGRLGQLHVTHDSYYRPMHHSKAVSQIKDHALLSPMSHTNLAHPSNIKLYPWENAEKKYQFPITPQTPLNTRLFYLAQQKGTARKDMKMFDD